MFPKQMPPINLGRRRRVHVLTFHSVVEAFSNETLQQLCHNKAHEKSKSYKHDYSNGHDSHFMAILWPLIVINCLLR